MHCSIDWHSSEVAVALLAKFGQPTGSPVSVCKQQTLTVCIVCVYYNTGSMLLCAEHSYIAALGAVLHYSYLYMLSTSLLFAR